MVYAEWVDESMPYPCVALYPATDFDMDTEFGVGSLAAMLGLPPLSSDAPPARLETGTCLTDTELTINDVSFLLPDNAADRVSRADFAKAAHDAGWLELWITRCPLSAPSFSTIMKTCIDNPDRSWLALVAV